MAPSTRALSSSGPVLMVLIGIASMPLTRAAGAQEQGSYFSAGGGAEFQLLAGSTIDGGFGPYVSGTWVPTDVEMIRFAFDASRVGLAEDVDRRSGVRANNTLWTIVAGPQLVVPIGRFSPYLGAVGGLQVGGWSIEGPVAERSGASTVTVWGGEVGLEGRVTDGLHPVSISAALRLVDGGEFSFGRAVPRERSGPGTVRQEEVATFGLGAGVLIGL